MLRIFPGHTLQNLSSDHIVQMMFCDYPDILDGYTQLLIAFVGKSELETSLRNDLIKYHTLLCEHADHLAEMEPYIVDEIRKSFEKFYGDCLVKSKAISLKKQESQEQEKESEMLRGVNFDFYT